MEKTHSQDTENAFLMAERDGTLESWIGGSYPEAYKALDSVGVQTYFQFLKYARDHNLSDLPGIGIRTAEALHQLLHGLELENKRSLEREYLATLKVFENLQQIAEVQLQKRGKLENAPSPSS